MLARRLLRAVLGFPGALFGASLGVLGCWYHVEEYCRGCTVVDHERVAVPAVPDGTHTEILLVHGSFGFGGEWKEVVATVQASPGFALLAWSWPGPFRDPKGDARALREEIQALVDRLPPSVDEVMVFAHSAGGLITNLAMRQIAVPPGKHVTFVLLDPTFWPALGRRDKYPPLPNGVAASAFFAREPPPSPTAKSESPNGKDGTDLPWHYVGAIGHDPMVAKASLPILEARRAAKSAAPAGGEDAPE